MKVVYADIILSIQRMTDRILMCNVDLWSVNTTSMDSLSVNDRFASTRHKIDHILTIFDRVRQKDYNISTCCFSE
jgi:hypothetical protein